MCNSNAILSWIHDNKHLLTMLAHKYKREIRPMKHKTFSNLPAALGSITILHSSYLLAGNAMENLAASLQPGECGELDTNGLEAALENPGGSNHTILAYSDGGAWNPGTRQFFYIGGDHMGGPQRFISYSADTNTWLTLFLLFFIIT